MPAPTLSPEKLQGDIPQLVIKGDNPVRDLFISDFLHLPEKTNVYYMSTSKILVAQTADKHRTAIKFISGREIRARGDTCRMFFTLKREEHTQEYYFWEGIVTGRLNNLKDNEFDYIEYGNQYEKIGNELTEVLGVSNQVLRNGFGLATGKSNFRMVLLEKIMAPKKVESH